MASLLLGVHRTHFLRALLSLFVCTVFVLIFHQIYQNESEMESAAGYKLVKESDIFSDLNSSVKMKTFFNTNLRPPGVILGPKGGIGNQLYQYACSYALAKDLGWPLYIRLESFTPSRRLFQPNLREFALDKFQIPLDNIIDKTTTFSVEVSYQSDRTFLQRTFLDIPNPRNQFVELGGYCQSIEYFKKYQQEIRAMFHLRKSAINFPKLQKMINKIKYAEVSVVVHVRRGDYVQRAYFIPTSYHRFAIEKLVSTLKARGKGKPVFFVFSDDIGYAQKKLKDFTETYEVVFVRQEITDTTSIEDFYLMTLCKHIIFANSTFGWWAAYLIEYVDKIVIASTHNPNYFSGFLGDDPFVDKKYGSLFHPKDWILIDPFTGGLVKAQ